jgi:hypothetical protein
MTPRLLIGRISATPSRLVGRLSRRHRSIRCPPHTSLLGLALPVTGELAGTWGDTVNDYITQYVDAAAAGTQTISGSQTAVTLTVTNGTSLSQAGSGSTGFCSVRGDQLHGQPCFTADHHGSGF